MGLRKNASLKAVAVHARKAATKHKVKWIARCKVCDEDPGLSSMFDQIADKHWELWKQADEMATHLERFAGITKTKTTDFDGARQSTARDAD
jgi:hypothetical protein